MKNDNSLRSQYEKILGALLGEFDVVCFRFRSLTTLRKFNYLALMEGFSGLLYDANENQRTVTIVFEKGSEQVARARRAAVDDTGAQEITPMML